MTFLAGESLARARPRATAADRKRAKRISRHWSHGLEWFIQCDRCGRIHEYTPAEGRRGWVVWARPPDYALEICACGCPPEQLELFDG